MHLNHNFTESTMVCLYFPFEQWFCRFPVEENLQESWGNLSDSLEAEIRWCQNEVNFILILLRISQGSQWWDQIPVLSCKFPDSLWSNIFEESKGNLKVSLRPRFRQCQNSTNWQSILHLSVTRIWWCIQIFNLTIPFFSHFSKWSASVNIQCVSSRFHDIQCHEIDGTTSSSSLSSIFFRWLQSFEVYAMW